MDDPFGFGETNNWTPSHAAAPVAANNRASFSSAHTLPNPSAPPAIANNNTATPSSSSSSAALPHSSSSNNYYPSVTSSPSAPVYSGAAAVYASMAGISAPPPIDIPRNWSIFPAESTFKIVVGEPEKRGDGMSQYIVYKCTLTISVDGATHSHTVVTRRYSDFAWLHEQLSQKYRGYLIPPIPEKQYVGRFEGDFIEERRRSLEQFLFRILGHPQLKHTNEVALFVTGQEGQLTAAKTGTKKENKNTSSGKGLMGFFSSIGHSVGKKEETPEDIQCARMSEYSNQLENQLNAMHTNVDELIKKNKSLAKSWFEFGLSCTVVGQSEGAAPCNQPVLANLFGHVGTTADKLSVMFNNEADAENTAFREPIRDYIRLAEAVKEMMKTRQAANLAYHASKESLEDKKKKLQSALSQGGKNDKVQIAERAVKDAEKDSEEKFRDLQQITTRSLYEFEQFKTQKQIDMKNMVVQFVKLQIEHSKKVQNAWQAILPEIENSRL